MIERMPAMRKFNMESVWVYISVSRVENPGPPSSRITPKLVKSNKNTINTAASMEGFKRGSVTLNSNLVGDAPSTDPAWDNLASSWLQALPTTRTTTDVL